MMQVFHDAATGDVLFTLSGDDPHGLTGPSITVPARDLGDLTGWQVQGGALVRADLQPARDAAIQTVNQTVGALRLGIITDIPGQMAIYMAKEAEARAYIFALPPPVDLTDWPLLAAEIGITAPTPWELAQVWLNLAAQFRQAAAQSERLRLGAKAAIAGAATEATLDAAITVVKRSIDDATPKPRGRGTINPNPKP
jgi:hypothetical protein